MTMKQHITYFDFLRGVAILMVLGIHTYVDGDFTSLEGTLKILFRQILNCAVPVFLALSAFFLGRKTFENRDSVLFFWKKQIPKVYIPCMVWSFPLLMILILEGGNILELICKMIVCGLSVYYFIALIIQYYLLLPFLQKHLKRNLIVAIISSVIAVLTVTYLLYIKGVTIPIIVYAGLFPVWFVFYMLGVYYSRKERGYSLLSVSIVVIFGLILEFVETYYLNTRFSGGVGIKLSSFIYSYGIILLVLHPRIEASFCKNKLSSFIVYIGKISFAIYLSHCYIISIVIRVVTFESWLMKFFVVSLLTIIIITLARRILPNKIKHYIGFT